MSTPGPGEKFKFFHILIITESFPFDSFSNLRPSSFERESIREYLQQDRNRIRDPSRDGWSELFSFENRGEIGSKEEEEEEVARF